MNFSSFTARAIVDDRLKIARGLREQAAKIRDKKFESEEEFKEERIRAVTLDYIANKISGLPYPQTESKEESEWMLSAFGVSSREQLVERFDELNRFKREHTS